MPEKGDALTELLARLEGRLEEYRRTARFANVRAEELDCVIVELRNAIREFQEARDGE